MRQSSWAELLRRAESEPTGFGGGRVDSHLRAAIARPLQLAWEKRCLLEPIRAVVALSQHQFKTCCFSGPLHPALEQSLQFDRCNNLIDELWDASERLPLIPETHGWLWDNTFDVKGVGIGLLLAERSALALRNTQGLWYQLFRNGWPCIRPMLIHEEAQGIGLFVTAALTAEYFPSLPFDPVVAKQSVPEAAQDVTEILWCTGDTLVPDEADCIFAPEAFRRWLGSECASLP
jgi:hypothetical protein